MAKSCIVKPRVKGRDGNWADSALFPQLKKDFGYEKAKAAYLMTKSPGFDAEFRRTYPDGTDVVPGGRKGRPQLRCDVNGEPLYRELLSRTEFLGVLDIATRKENALRSMGSAADAKAASRKNIDAADEAADSYNTSESRDPMLIAMPRTERSAEAGCEAVGMTVVIDDDSTRREASDNRRKRTLNSRLRGLLKSWGIGVGALTRTERLMRANGVTDFSATRLTAEGLVEMIRLARGEAGEEALPEEFSHIAVEALKDSPLMKRLFRTVHDNGLAKAIIGEELYEAYREAYTADALRRGYDAEEQEQWDSLKTALSDGAEFTDYWATAEGETEARLIYEAIGRLVAERILRSYGDVRTDAGQAESLMKKIAAAYSDRFGALDDTAITEALRELDAGVSEFADGLMSGGFSRAVTEGLKSVATDRTFYSLEDRVAKQRETLTKLLDNSIRRIKIMYGDRPDTSESESVRIMQTRLTDQEYELGIMEFASSALDKLKELDNQLTNIDDKPRTVNEKCRTLKRAKDFISSYANAIDLINEARFNGAVNVSDDRLTTVAQVTELVAKLKSNYESIANPLFTDIISQFVGESITVPFGKMKGTVYTAADIAKMADHDISILDRWLDSMAESGDWVLRMMDSIAKESRARARRRVLDIKATMDSAFMKLRSAGYADTDFMYERDMKGSLTGKYIDAEAARLLPQAQREYYETAMAVKRKCDLLLPDGATELTNTVKIRKDLVERMKERGARGKVGEVIESVKDMFMKRSDDTEYGGEKSVLMDFEGNKVERLPIFYIKQKAGEDPNDITTDTTSSLVLYADMACNYHEMNESLGTLEFMRDRMRRRDVQVTEGGRKLRNALSSFGVKIVTDLTVPGSESNITARMNDWFESQVYGRYMKDEGEVLGVSVAKGANFINYITSLNQFALNIMAGISNVMTGGAMMHIEQAAGEFFSASDTLKADGIFAGELPKYVADINSPVKRSKLALFNIRFNSLIDYESMVRGLDYQKSRLAKLFQNDTLYFINSAGELWLQSRCALSMAVNTKLRLNGREINLWDAYEVADNGDGTYALRLRDGVTKADGSAFTAEDETRFTNRAKAVNQRMNGIYNYEDRCAAQAYAVGRLGLMFRKWIKTSLNRRYGHTRYNFDLGSWEEGYYRTAGRFVMQLGRDLRAHSFDAAMRWNQLTVTEKANMRRSLAEACILTVVSLMFAMLTRLKRGDDDDDDDEFTDTWFFNQTRYQVRRLEAELGAMMPTPAIFDEALTILKSPAACIDPTQDLLNLIKVCWPANWTDESRLKSGKYKGRTRAHKYLMESPLVPMWNTIYRGLHPENSVNFFSSDNG